MIYNYHTHTTRCRHANDKDEEYIIKSINAGIKYLGFSDHAPFIFPDGYESTFRVEMSAVEDYFSSIKALREKYRDKIDIKIGLEMEYYPAYFPAMFDIAAQNGAEYLILGQHYIYNEHPNGRASILKTDNPEHLREYVDCVVGGIRTGAFTYVCHPDIVNFLGDDQVFEKETRRLCTAAKEYETPLEINFLGIRSSRNYPNKKFWQIAGEIGVPVTFGMDAHNAADAVDFESLPIAANLVREFNLNYIGMPKMLPIGF